MSVFQFKIQLKNISKPPVWRRVLIPADFTFNAFHKVIQTAFGWEDQHLYHFSRLAWRSEPVYEIPDPDYENEGAEDSRKVKLSEVFTASQQTFTYVYDFGDDWIHSIILEEIRDEEIMVPICIDGKSACPPEDSGGPWGYLNLLETLSNPKHAGYEDVKEWLGLDEDEQWDVNAFDIKAANDRLKSVNVTN